MYWQGFSPTKCQLNGEQLTTTFVDGALAGGSWGILCPTCHKAYGVGLGTGKGQRYEKQSDGRWKKTAG